MKLLILLCIFYTIHSKVTDKQICSSQTCIKEAQNIVARINRSINPCDDFYQFTCGVSPDLKFDIIKTVKENMTHQLLEICDDKEGDDHKVVRIAKNLFKKCMDEDAIEKDGLEVIRGALKQIGGWPVLEGDSWNEDDFDWINATFKLRELGYPWEVFFTVERDESNTMVFSMKTDEEVERRCEIHEVDRMKKTARLFGSATATRDEIEDELDLAFKFWESLNGPLPKENVYNKSWNSAIDRLVDLNKEGLEAPKGFNISGSFKEKVAYISKTPKRIVANSMLWLIINELLPYFPKEISKWSKINKEKTRIDLCLRTVDESFLSNPIKIIRGRRCSSNKTENKVEELMQSMKSELLEKLERIEWMNEGDRKFAVEKARKMDVKIDAYEDYFDDKVLDELDVDVVSPENSTFFDFLADIKKSYYVKKLNRADPIRHKADTVNKFIPYYNRNSNAIVVPTFIMEGFFDEEKPNYLNYGHLAGFAFSHFIMEIHNMNIGSDHYKKLSRKTNNRLIEKMLCLSNQKEYDALEMFVTLMFAIEAEIAYAAYEKWENMNGIEPKLIGLDYSPRQLFWITHTNCAVLKTSKHPREEIWISAVVKSKIHNSNFIKDFNCTAKSVLNSNSVCQIF